MKYSEENLNRLDNVSKFANDKNLFYLFFNKNNLPTFTWFQRHFKKDGNEISLIHLGFNDIYGEYQWEIYCTKGELFEDVERYKTLMEVILRIKTLLKIKKSDFDKRS